MPPESPPGSDRNMHAFFDCVGWDVLRHQLAGCFSGDPVCDRSCW
jgi:hypothetical protein